MNKFLLILGITLFSVMLFNSNIYAASWPSEFPTIPTINLSNGGATESLIYKDTAGDYRLLVYIIDTNGNQYNEAVRPYARFVTNDSNSRISVGANYGGYTANYILKDNEWVLVSDIGSIGTNGDRLVNSSVSEFIYTEVDVKLSNGTVVFPVANPTLTLEEVVQVETLNLQDKTIQTMKIIVLCGVGCLALLIGLKILPKTLLKFLAR